MVNFGSTLSTPYILTKDDLNRQKRNDQHFQVLPLIENIHNIGTY